MALIGESGSGKSTIALALMGYTRPGCRIRRRQSAFVAPASAISRVPSASDCAARRSPTSPRARLRPSIRRAASCAQVIEPTRDSPHDAARRTHAPRPSAYFGRWRSPTRRRSASAFPHQVSGGQLQRLMLAMALITDPAIVILDEPTTALDVTTQIEVLEAFKVAVRDRGITALYVSHDLAVVAQMADRIVVLRKGEMQETGSTAALLDQPSHPYTRSLLEAAEPARRVRSGGGAAVRRLAVRRCSR